MALPNSNISTTLVGNTIGSGSRDVGTLCTHPNINMWSRRKPVRDVRVVVPEEEVGLGDNCGLALQRFSGDDTLVTTYNRPGTWVDKLGQHSTPLRLGDFRGYEHTITVRPVTTGNPPANIQRKQGHIIVQSVTHPMVPVVTLPDFGSEFRLGAFIYGKLTETGVSTFIGCATADNQLDPAIIVNLSNCDKLLLDIKFALVDGRIPWTTEMPTDKVMYEIPRQFKGENQNWYNVKLVTPPEDVRTFEIAGFISQQQVQYVIEAYTTTTGRIDIVPSSGTIIQINNIQLPANTRVSATKTNMPLVSGVTYTAYLYLGASSTPVATRPMIVS